MLTRPRNWSRNRQGRSHIRSLMQGELRNLRKAAVLSLQPGADLRRWRKSADHCPLHLQVLPEEIPDHARIRADPMIGIQSCRQKSCGRTTTSLSRCSDNIWSFLHSGVHSPGARRYRPAPPGTALARLGWALCTRQRIARHEMREEKGGNDVLQSAH
jgi:hypothetical protein